MSLSGTHNTALAGLQVSQQAYSANTRIITTTNTMVQDLLNVIR